ncbi:MAG: S-adenosylmethionine:tRNA ribosyltransferase-isomerase [Bacteriovoracia bacterium]
MKLALETKGTEFTSRFGGSDPIPFDSHHRLASSRLMKVEEVGVPPIQHRAFAEIADLFSGHELLVVNDAATLPASLRVVHVRSARLIEIRLIRNLSWLDTRSPVANVARWEAVAFGEGDWRTRTEDRPAPPTLLVGDQLRIGIDENSCLLRGHVTGHSPISPRLFTLQFDGTPEAIWSALYCMGRPIQYSHRTENLEIWDAQTLFTGPPVAAEAPSAAFPFNWRTLLALKAKGVEVAAITHASGLSSVGDPLLDARLPLPESYTISPAVAEAVLRAKRASRPVIALGTTVTRALESAAQDETIAAGSRETSLRITARHRLQVVDELITGMHEPGSSHLELLQAFVSPETLKQAYREATDLNYQWHENGDMCWLKRTPTST